MSSTIQPEPSRFLSFRLNKGILRRSLQTTPISEFSDTSCNRNDDKNGNDNGVNHLMNWGTLTVSWYEGTKSLALQEHVENSVIRKLGLGSTTKLLNLCVLYKSTDPSEGTYWVVVINMQYLYVQL